MEAPNSATTKLMEKFLHIKGLLNFGLEKSLDHPVECNDDWVIVSHCDPESFELSPQQRRIMAAAAPVRRERSKTLQRHCILRYSSLDTIDENQELNFFSPIDDLDLKSFTLQKRLSPMAFNSSLSFKSGPYAWYLVLSRRNQSGSQRYSRSLSSAVKPDSIDPYDVLCTTVLLARQKCEAQRRMQGVPHPRFLTLDTRTAFVNFEHVHTWLGRPALHLMTYLLALVQKAGSLEGGSLLIEGNVAHSLLHCALHMYIKRYVACQRCRSLCTELVEVLPPKTGLRCRKCRALTFSTLRPTRTCQASCSPNS